MNETVTTASDEEVIKMMEYNKEVEKYDIVFSPPSLESELERKRKRRFFIFGEDNTYQVPHTIGPSRTMGYLSRPGYYCSAVAFSCNFALSAMQCIGGNIQDHIFYYNRNCYPYTNTGSRFGIKGVTYFGDIAVLQFNGTSSYYLGYGYYNTVTTIGITSHGYDQSCLKEIGCTASGYGSNYYQHYCDTPGGFLGGPIVESSVYIRGINWGTTSSPNRNVAVCILRSEL